MQNINIHELTDSLNLNYLKNIQLELKLPAYTVGFKNEREAEHIFHLQKVK